MSRAPFIELPIGRKVLFVEEVRRRFYEAAEQAGTPFREDKPLSPAAVAWVDRMRAALASTEVSKKTVDEMDAAMREALPDEADELVRRLEAFAIFRDAIPLSARRPEEALLPVYERLRERAESEA